MSRRKNKQYSPEQKTAAAEAYIAGEGSLRQICKEHGIKDKHSLRDWISCYNSHKEFKRWSAAKEALYMTKGKKNTAGTSRNGGILHRTR